MPAGWDFGARVADATALRRLDVEGDGRHRSTAGWRGGGGFMRSRLAPRRRQRSPPGAELQAAPLEEAGAGDAAADG